MIGFLSSVLQIVALTAAALLPLINPPGSAPIFLSMSAGASDDTRALLARKVALNSFLLLLGAVVVGSYVLTFFGLSLAAVKIAGGLLVCATGWSLIRADAPDGEPSGIPVQEHRREWNPAFVATRGFYPLTFPLTIGPGAVSVAITLGASTQAHPARLLAAVVGTIAGILLVSLAVYGCYRFASRLLHALGRTGTIVILRLSAFILMAVGVQILCDGVAERFDLRPSRLR